ncbi:MAG: hypothetical protein ACRD04_12220 [Terriglobales bacterium]
MALRSQVLATIAVALLLAAATAAAQIPGQDPLTPEEANQVRNTAGRLDKRIPLLLRFAEERLASFRKIRSGPPNAPGRSAQLYALLRQYRAILPELNDAMDDLSSPGEPGGPKYKIPKILPGVIEAQKQLVAELQQIRSNSPATDLATYHFELQDCLDATRDSLQDAEQDLAGASKGRL